VIINLGTRSGPFIGESRGFTYHLIFCLTMMMHVTIFIGYIKSIMLKPQAEALGWWLQVTNEVTARMRPQQIGVLMPP